MVNFPDISEHIDTEECPKCGTVNPVYLYQNAITCRKCGHKIWVH